MEKKFKFSDNPNAAKIIYGAVIALLCITAVIIGIVAANSRHRDNTPEDNNPPIVDENGGNGGENDSSPAEHNNRPYKGGQEGDYNVQHYPPGVVLMLNVGG